MPHFKEKVIEKTRTGKIDEENVYFEFKKIRETCFVSNVALTVINEFLFANALNNYFLLVFFCLNELKKKQLNNSNHAKKPPYNANLVELTN